MAREHGSLVGPHMVVSIRATWDGKKARPMRLTCSRRPGARPPPEATGRSRELTARAIAACSRSAATSRTPSLSNGEAVLDGADALAAGALCCERRARPGANQPVLVLRRAVDHDPHEGVGRRVATTGAIRKDDR